MSEGLNVAVLTVMTPGPMKQTRQASFSRSHSWPQGISLLIVPLSLTILSDSCAAFVWIADRRFAVLVTGGTVFGRDSTPEAVLPLFDKTIEGFGEVFRALSFDEIGSSTVQSRAMRPR